MGKPANKLQNVAQLMGDKTFTAWRSPCVCGCTQFYTCNASCVDCTKARSRNRYATPEGKKTQREGDRRRYQKRIANPTD